MTPEGSGARARGPAEAAFAPLLAPHTFVQGTLSENVCALGGPTVQPVSKGVRGAARARTPSDFVGWDGSRPSRTDPPLRQVPRRGGHPRTAHSSAPDVS